MKRFAIVAAMLGIGSSSIAEGIPGLDPSSRSYWQQMAALKVRADICIEEAIEAAIGAGGRYYGQVGGFAYKACRIAMDPVIALTNPSASELPQARASWIQPILMETIARLHVTLEHDPQ